MRLTKQQIDEIAARAERVSRADGCVIGIAPHMTEHSPNCYEWHTCCAIRKLVEHIRELEAKNPAA